MTLPKLGERALAGSLWPAGLGGFSDPGWAAALLPIALFLLVRAARRRPAALPWPALPEARTAGAKPRDRLRAVAFALRTATLVALVAALCGPLGPERAQSTRHEGLDLLLVVDASGSMRALDAGAAGAWRTRLDLAREVVARFARRRVAEGDRVGLVVFGDSAFTQCPLTSDGSLLEAALERVEAGMAGEATALGDALALAVKRVKASRPAPVRDGPPGSPHAGSLIVLLTDGRANAGSIPPDVAMALAAHEGTRVHTVGIGARGEVAMAHPTREGELRFERHDLDEETLERIAAATGGRAYLARSSADLGSVYAEIDALERVARPAPPRLAGAPLPEPFLGAAAVLLLLEVAVDRVFGRRLP